MAKKKEKKLFQIEFLNGKEVLDPNPLPRTPRLQSAGMYDFVMKTLELQRRMNQVEEYDSPKEFMDFSDDEEDDLPEFTEAEKAFLQLQEEQARELVQNIRKEEQERMRQQPAGATQEEAPKASDSKEGAV